ncbi:MAG: cupin domain-containing protein [Ilumatobacteraceae bacterium]
MTGDPRVDLRPYQAWGRTIIPLSQHADGVTAIKQIIPARAEPETPTPQRHDGYEWVYVLSGRLRLVVADHDLTLEPGQAAEFDTRHPHWTGSADGEPVEYLCLLDEHGERLHLGTDGLRPEDPGARTIPASFRAEVARGFRCRSGARRRASSRCRA